MKSFSFIILALFCLTTFSACEQEEVAPFHTSNQRPLPDAGGFAPDPLPDAGGFANNPSSPTVQPIAFYPLVFSKAKGWYIKWKVPSMASGSFPHKDHDFWDNCAGFLSTVDGSLRSINELNNLGWEATADTDMYIPIGKLRSPSGFPLVHAAHRRATFFKLSNMTSEEMMSMAHHSPNNFEEAYEENPASPEGLVPYDPYDHSAFYQEDEVYVFKTGRNPAKYGAIRIIDGPSYQANSFSIVQVEVVVQDDGWKNYYKFGGSAEPGE